MLLRYDRTCAGIAAISYGYNVINLVLYVLNLQTRDGLRQMIYYGGLVMMAYLILIMFVRGLSEGLTSVSTITLIVIVGMFSIAGIFSIPLIGVSSDTTYYIGCFIIISIPKLLAGMMVGRVGGGDYFIKVLSALAFLSVPGCICYIIGFFTGTVISGQMGFISYMVMAFTILPFFIINLIKLNDYHSMDRADRTNSLWLAKVWEFCLLLLFSLVIIMSGTRSAFVIIFMVLIFLVAIGRRLRKSVRSVVALIVAVPVFVLFNAYVYTLPGFARLGRIKGFLYELSEGRILTDLVGYDNGYTTESIQRLAEGLVLNGTGGLYLADRGTLYKLATMEFLRSPIIGMGSMRYIAKYGTYVHNVSLEVLSETGMLGFIPMCIVVATLLVRGWRNVGMDDKDGTIFLLAIAALVKGMMSGSIWTSSELFFFAGYFASVRTIKNPVDTIEEMML